jgi:UDP-N-acetylmuramate dehydrogenase
MDKIIQKFPAMQKNVLLKDYTTYKIGGPAKYFFVAKTKEELSDALKIGKEFKLPIFILGGGSNLLVSERGFKGLVIKVDISGMEFDGEKITAGAGTDLTKLAYFSAEKGLSGLEWSAGIPGTLGGAIYGHAQAFGTKISEAVELVQALDLKTLKIREFSKEQCKFSVKNSLFKKTKNFVIVSAILDFKKSDSAEIKNKIKEFLEYRKARHPINFASAGSTFVNPEVKIKNKKLLDKFPELVEFNEKGVIHVGYLVSKSGLTGKKIGKAQISEKHSNFIVNIGGAKSKDVIALMNLAKKKVKKVFGVSLETEVQFVGF